MTDNEIIKALECHASDAEVCKLCPLTNEEWCSVKLARKTLDLINRQKAEIERLKAECGNQSTLWSQHYESIFETAKETIKAEAVKEVIETMKPWYRFLCVDKSDWCEQLDTHAYNLVKEMVGEN